MENQNIKGLELLTEAELAQTRGADGWEWLKEIVDFLIDYYPIYVENGCPGVYNEGCNSIGMGLSGNTAFTGY
jgi:hypothetical protein